jgi:elongator complex protein 3
MPTTSQKPLSLLIKSLLKHPPANSKDLTTIIKKFPKSSGGFYKKSTVLPAYIETITRSNIKPNQLLLSLLRTKPIRSSSGVTVITVLTKPFACPGECIFCPNDISMPKSYIASEPGAQRALHHSFDPYAQTYTRLLALQNIGHPVDKAEIIVLGGTWSVYPLPYRIWFIKRCFDALNDFGQGKDHRHSSKPSLIINSKLIQKHAITNTRNGLSSTYNQTISRLYGEQERQKRIQNRESSTWAQLEKVQLLNQNSPIRCVGLVLESRPDNLTPQEVLILRQLGATKTQIGLQSLQDDVLIKNKRGHSVADAAKAMDLLRLAGFKIHAHWMPNLYGSTPEIDKQDYLKLYHHLSFKPDELKIYPCSLIPGTELVEKYEKGEWQPYTKSQLLDVLSHSMTNTPRYSRLTRIIRDIPGHEIAVGNKITNFRQLVEAHCQKEGLPLQDIRSREIRHQPLDPATLKLKSTHYKTSATTEYFLEWVGESDQIAGFLRLSLPNRQQNPITPELHHTALIREVHVYGQAIAIGKKGKAAQHQGFGKKLILKAESITQKHGFKRLAVISAIGTREYYAKLGYTLNELYQIKPL